MKLTILSTSDTHAFVAPTNYAQKVMDLPIGLARAKTVIDDLRAHADGPVVTIENGDWLQGSPFGYYAARVAQDATILPALYNLVGYDAGVLGNHEFNFGREYLTAAVHALNYPVVGANVVAAGAPVFGPGTQVFTRAGVRIAVVGVTTDYIPHWESAQNLAGIEFTDVFATAAASVAAVRATVDVVIVAYHGGFERDLVTGAPTETLTGENVGYELLTKIPGVDALVTGHQHRPISMVVNEVPTTQPGYRGANVGAITLELERDGARWRVADATATLHPTATATPDAAIMALMATQSTAMNKWLDAPLARVDGDMTITDPNAARLAEHPYIELVNRVQMWATGSKIAGTALFNDEVTGFGPVITMRAVVTNYIYPNTVAVVRVTGAELKAALEQTNEYWRWNENGQVYVNPKYLDPKPQAYNYDMYDGIDYVVDLRHKPGARITKLEYAGAPVTPDGEYEVAVNRYRAGGGGDFAMFTAAKIVRENQRDMTELIADYLRLNPVVEATVDNNWRVKR